MGASSTGHEGGDARAFADDLQRKSRVFTLRVSIC